MEGFEFSNTACERGMERINWVRRFMPVCKSELSVLEAAPPRHIGVSQPLEPKLASLCLWLKEAGYSVSVLALESPSVAQDSRHVLHKAGVALHHDLDTFLSEPFEILIDDDGSVLSQVQSTLLGAALSAQTLTPFLDGMDSKAAPVIHMATSELIQSSGFFEGLGQACVSGFLDITNLQLAGRKVLVTSYDLIGSGIAAFSRAYGARVTIAHTDPDEALRAASDGYDVSRIDTAVSEAEIVFNTRSQGVSINASNLRKLPDGAFLCSAVNNAEAWALPEPTKEADAVKLREYVTEYMLENGRKVKLICEGNSAPFFAGEGLPIECADIVLAAYILTIADLSRGTNEWAAGLQTLPNSIEDKLQSGVLEICQGT